MPGVPRLSLGVVDVREVAAAHVRAMAHPSPPPRCILVAEDLWMGEVAARIQALFPDLRVTTRVLPKLVVLAASLFDPNLNTRQLAKLVGLALRHDARLSREAYGIAYRPVDDTLRETVEPMIRNGWARVTRR
jgi:dihydroflavonol-4-reductase